MPTSSLHAQSPTQLINRRNRLHSLLHCLLCIRFGPQRAEVKRKKGCPELFDSLLARAEFQLIRLMKRISEGVARRASQNSPEIGHEGPCERISTHTHREGVKQTRPESCSRLASCEGSLAKAERPELGEKGGRRRGCERVVRAEKKKPAAERRTRG